MRGGKNKLNKVYFFNYLLQGKIIFYICDMLFHHKSTQSSQRRRVDASLFLEHKALAISLTYECTKVGKSVA